MSASPWTPEEDARLVEAARDGVAVVVLSADMGRTESAIRSRAKRLKASFAVEGRVQKGGWGPDEDEVLRRMAGEGRHAVEIGAQVGRSRMAVIGRAARLGVELHGTPDDGANRARRLHPTVSVPGQVVKDIVTVPGHIGVGLLALTDTSCKAPISGEGVDTVFCGAPRGGSGHHPYCLGHQAILTVPWKAKTPRTGNELARSLRRYTK